METQLPIADNTTESAGRLAGKVPDLMSIDPYLDRKLVVRIIVLQHQFRVGLDIYAILASWAADSDETISIETLSRYVNAVMPRTANLRYFIRHAWLLLLLPS